MEKSKFIIDTRYNHVNKLIFLNEPSKDSFLEQCKWIYHLKLILMNVIALLLQLQNWLWFNILGKIALKIKIDGARILLTTSTGAPIPENRIGDVIEAAGPYLSVNLYLGERDGESGIVIPNVCHRKMFELNFIIFFKNIGFWLFKNRILNNIWSIKMPRSFWMKMKEGFWLKNHGDCWFVIWMITEKNVSEWIQTRHKRMRLLLRLHVFLHRWAW